MGSLANIIVVERARRGASLGFGLHTSCEVPMTLLPVAAACGWLAARTLWAP
ncbi:MAG: hypothetical protein ACXW25_03965 [Rhodospirillales bacterium]